MAKIIMNDKEIEVPDNSKIKDACMEFGVIFGCGVGVCGTCEIEVIEGAQNLTQITEEEIDMGMKGNLRLACQCRIKSGTVKIKYNY